MRALRLARFVSLSLMLTLIGLSLINTTAFAQSQQTASQFYMKFRAAFEKAKTVDELLPYMAKENRAQIAATPADDKAKMFEMMKMMNKLSDVKITKEEKTAAGATLTVTGVDADKKKVNGSVDVVKEEGEWKIGKESWRS
jgi:hypothetical protein